MIPHELSGDLSAAAIENLRVGATSKGEFYGNFVRIQITLFKHGAVDDIAAAIGCTIVVNVAATGTGTAVIRVRGRGEKRCTGGEGIRPSPSVFGGSTIWVGNSGKDMLGRCAPSAVSVANDAPVVALDAVDPPEIA